MTRSTLLTGAAIAILFGSSGAALAEGMFPSPTGWEGFYIGVNGAYAQGTASDGGMVFPDIPLEGEFYGGQAGYNFVLDGGMVISVQGDLDWSNETGSVSENTIGIFDDATLTDTVDWTGDLIGRVGFTAGPVMFYGLGGLALASNTLQNIGVDQLQGPSPAESDVTNTHMGYTAGVGLSGMMGQASAFIEYRYSDYGTADYSPAVDEPVSVVNQEVRVGVNYHMQ